MICGAAISHYFIESISRQKSLKPLLMTLRKPSLKPGISLPSYTTFYSPQCSCKHSRCYQKVLFQWMKVICNRHHTKVTQFSSSTAVILHMVCYFLRKTSPFVWLFMRKWRHVLDHLYSRRQRVLWIVSTIPCSLMSLQQIDGFQVHWKSFERFIRPLVRSSIVVVWNFLFARTKHLA